MRQNHLNFVAFQNTNSYTVVDRIILFSEINLFVLLGIYFVFSMIKSLLNIKIETKAEFNWKGKPYFSFKYEKLLTWKTIVLVGIFSLIFGLGLYFKKNVEEKEKITKDGILKIKTEVENMKKNISKFESNINSTLKSNNNANQNYKNQIESKRLELKEELLNLEKRMNHLELNSTKKIVNV